MNKLLLIVVLIFTASCNNSGFKLTPCGQKHYLESSVKISLALNDTLIYKSNHDEILYSIRLFDSGLIFYSQTGQSISDCLAYYEFEIIGICPLDDTSCQDTSDQMLYSSYDCQVCEGCMTICKKMSTEPINSKFKTMEDPILSYYLWNDRLSNHTQYKSEFQINNIEYRNCYIFNISNSDISELYYNHEFGFIGFKTSTNITYNLKI